MRCGTCNGTGLVAADRMALECCGHYVTNRYGEPVVCCDRPVSVPSPDFDACPDCYGYGSLPQALAANDAIERPM